jgi:hypothetical protein
MSHFDELYGPAGDGAGQTVEVEDDGDINVLSGGAAQGSAVINGSGVIVEAGHAGPGGEN